MIFLAILASLAAIGLLCWLLFTLAVFALPAFVGVTAGASAPEVLVQRILVRLREFGVQEVLEVPGEPEAVVFQMPPELNE